jgi:flagellar protein FlaJ
MISWGLPLSKIYQEFVKRTYGWLERAGMFILIDAIDVGGGAPETLEVLTTFSEDLEEIERQKRATLRPLMMIPYLTALLLVTVVVILVAGKISTSRVAGGFVHAVILSAVSLIAIWITGIVSVQLFKLPSVS